VISKPAEARRPAVEPLAHRLLARMRALGDRYPGIEVGASVGMAFFESAPESAEAVLHQADRAMYEAKSAGKHRFALWSSDSNQAVVQT